MENKACNASWKVDETYIKGATRTWSLTLPEAKEARVVAHLRRMARSLL